MTRGGEGGGGGGWCGGGFRSIRTVVGIICPSCLNLLTDLKKKSVWSRPSGPVSCRRRRHCSQIALFITFAFSLLSILRFQIKSFLSNITCLSLIVKLALTIHLSVMHLFETKVILEFDKYKSHLNLKALKHPFMPHLNYLVLCPDMLA